MKITPAFAVILAAMLAACAGPAQRESTKGHLAADSAKTIPASDIPPPVEQTLALPKPRAIPKAETYSVVVNNVPVKDLLFALARDAKLNVDIHAGIAGSVTLNAIDQTLPQLLNRIAKQVDMRFELDGPNLVVMPDTPFLRHYTVDYVNMTRSVTGTVSTATQIATGTSTGTGGSGTGGSGGNISSTRIENASKNLFWESLDKNIKDILRETDKILPEGSSETVVEQSASQTAGGAAALPQGSGQRAAQAIANALSTNPSPTSASQASGNTVVRRSTFREAASVIINPEAGIVTVRATSRQHEKIQEFLSRVINSARRQVMIEATIVEVTLSDGYQQGIDWSRLRTDGSGFALTRPATGTSGPNSGSNTAFHFVLKQLSWPLNLVSAIDLLQSFGTTKVLSSPRLSVLNNQTALLKVVENIVYFNVKADTTTTANVGTTVAVTTTPQSVSVGLLMTVTPQISDNDSVILNVRPTISGVSDWRKDPNPANTQAGVENWVPQIRTKEIESVMRVSSGDIAVLGGLMEDSADYKTGRIPGLGQIPVAGELVTKRDNSSRKSELVIFLRPIVVRDASLAGDYAGLRDHLPDTGFFQAPPEAIPFNVTPGR